MRRMKKLLAIVAAIATLCCGVSVMSTSAAVRDKDTNNDGSIDILDVIVLNRYNNELYNKGPRFNSTILQFYRNNPNISY